MGTKNRTGATSTDISVELWSYVKGNLPARRRLDLEPRSSEVLCIEVQSGRHNLLVCMCYRVQYHSAEDFCDEVRDMVDHAAAQFDGIYIIGDLNARHSLFWNGDRTTTEGRTVMTQFSDMGMEQLIHEPTRRVPASNTCIDLLFTNHPSSVTSSGTRDKLSENCDHLPIYAEIRFPKLKPKCYKRLVWNFARGNFDSFRQLLLNAPWQSCYVQNDIDATAER